MPAKQQDGTGKEWREKVAAIAFCIFVAGFYWLDDQRMHRNLFYALIPVMMFCGMRLNFWKRFFRQMLVRLVLLYMAYQAASIGWSEIFTFQELGEVLRKAVLSLFFMAAAAIVLIQQQKWWVLWVISSIAALAAIVSMVDYLMLSEAADRMMGIGRGRNPIQSATLYGVALLLTAYGLLRVIQCKTSVPDYSQQLQLFRPEPLQSLQATDFAMIRTSNRLFWFTLVCAVLAWGVLFSAMLLTQSRGALLAVTIAHIVMVLSLFPLGRGIRIIGLFSLLGLIFFLSFADWQGWLQRADGSRFEIWQQVLTLWMQQPLAGLGYRTPFAMELTNGQVIFQPHSLYISALYYGGALGLILLLSLFAAAFFIAVSASADRPLALALLINAVVFAVVDYNLLLVNSDMEWLLFWLPLALVTAIAMQRKQSINGNQ